MTIWDNAQPWIAGAKRYAGSVQWELTVSGLIIDGNPIEGYADQGTVMSTIFASFGGPLASAAAGIFVPLELLAALIGLVVDAVGSDMTAVQNYRYQLPGYVDDTSTPDRIVIGCTGILLSAAQTITGNPALTASDLADPTTNINACASLIASTVSQNKLDPVYVAAIYNTYGLFYSEASRWCMRRFDGDDTAIDRYTKWFNAAVYTQRTTPLTGANYAVKLSALAYRPLPDVELRPAYHTVEAQQLIQQIVSVISTASAVLTDFWWVYGQSWESLTSQALDYASGLGLPGGGSTTTLANSDGTNKTVTGPQLVTLYDGLRTYVAAISDYDTGVATSLPTQPVAVA